MMPQAGLARDLLSPAGDVRFTTTAAALLTSACLLAGGCAHEAPAWPPPAAEIERINADAADEHYLRVEYVEPLRSQRGARKVKVASIEAVDADMITFRTPDGDTYPVPSDMVRALSVKDRDRGGLAGGAFGAAATLLLMVGDHVLPLALSDSGGCFLYCDPKVIGTSLAITTFIGVVFGYAVGGRRTVAFGRGR